MYRLNMQRCICCDYLFLLSLSLYMILPLLLNNNTILQSLVGAIVRYLLGYRKVDIFDTSKATNENRIADGRTVILIGMIRLKDVPQPLNYFICALIKRLHMKFTNKSWISLFWLQILYFSNWF